MRGGTCVNTASAGQTPKLSIVIPAKNEAENLDQLVPALRASHPDAEIVVVDDGSSDGTGPVAAAHGARVIRHPYSMGNGAAVKTGARAASGEVIVFMDADGQHPPEVIPQLLHMLQQGYEMVVGARTAASQAGRRRLLGNYLYNRLASLITGHRILDLTSGFRAVKANRFREFLYLLPNGFSYPTTITMAFFRSGYPVGYVPFHAPNRRGSGKSHIRLARDGLRFLLIIFRIGTLYSPLKIFFPASVLFLLAGLGLYLETVFSATPRFSNMSAMLMLSGIMVFLIGLVAEQITTLMYANASDRAKPAREEPRHGETGMSS